MVSVWQSIELLRRCGSGRTFSLLCSGPLLSSAPTWARGILSPPTYSKLAAMIGELHSGPALLLAARGNRDKWLNGKLLVLMKNEGDS